MYESPQTETTRNGDLYEINQMSQDSAQCLHSCLCTGLVKLYSQAHALYATCPTIKGKEDQVSLKTQRRYFKKNWCQSSVDDSMRGLDRRMAQCFQMLIWHEDWQVKEVATWWQVNVYTAKYKTSWSHENTLVLSFLTEARKITERLVFYYKPSSIWMYLSSFAQEFSKKKYHG